MHNAVSRSLQPPPSLRSVIRCGCSAHASCTPNAALHPAVIPAEATAVRVGLTYSTNRRRAAPLQPSAAGIAVPSRRACFWWRCPPPREGHRSDSPPPFSMRASQRAYATWGSGSSGPSLSELAKAFQQMGSATDDRGNSSGRRCKQPEPSAAAPAAVPTPSDDGETTRNANAASRAHATRHRNAPTPPHPRAAPGGAPPANTSCMAPLAMFSVAYAEHIASLGDAQLCSEVESQLSRQHIGCALQCLYEVITHRLPDLLKAEAPTATAAGEVEGVGAAPVINAAAGYAAHGSASPSSLATHPEFQKAALTCSEFRLAQHARKVGRPDHRLLTAVLRMASLVDVYAMGPVMDAWRHATTLRNENRNSGCCLSSSATEKTLGRPNPPASPFSCLLAQALLRWLSREVSCMDAHTSLHVLHLLAQQNLAWDEAVLETLVDTLEVHLTQAQRAARPFTVEQYSLLLDAMARFQAQQVNVTRLQSLLPSADPSQTSRTPLSASSAETAAEEVSFTDESGAAVRHAVMTGEHPVANTHRFRCVVEALTRELAAPHRKRDPLRVGTATVLFLTRALSKLQWWSDALMSALAPHLTRYLQLHLESYAGVVMLVGRRENNVGDAALLYVLQESLLVLLRRRHRTRDAVEVPARAHGARPTRAIAAQGASGSISKEATGTPLPAEMDPVGHDAVLLDRRESEGTVGGVDGAVEEDDEGEWMLFSGRDGSEPSFDGGTHFTAGTSKAPVPQRRADTPLSLVDLHAFPSFLESLARFHLRTLQSMSSIPVVLPAPDRTTSVQQIKQDELVITREVLQTQMSQLLTLLQDDLQRSIPSLVAFAATTTSPLLEQLLCALITATEQLQLAYHPSESEEQNALPVFRPSPLMVELTYVWTLQIARLRPPPLPPRDGRASQATSDVARFYRIAGMQRWRRAVRVHHVLVRSGLLQRTQSRFMSPHATAPRGMGEGATSPPAAVQCEPGRYFIPEAVMRLAPRVQAAVEHAMQHLRAERERRLSEREGGGDVRGSGGCDPVYPSELDYSQPQRRSRFASASIRGASSHQHEHVSAQRQRTSGAAAAVTQPVRTSDVFASYSKSLSRLL
ncbi:hypothetical protein ABL78_8233 [Leptomonas seymouri]|uniref:Uncharacterized protein n=1 Tax=Leptomonas seymouri TaxID=5684 RepID=A0A0N1IG87_LEPSE|nr:hypothetical protein ABL78_8233 [Leptomonas seymouri]|eukprot:KPI82753.1 hypothetical protein ABL78_8233 [Leptomonas seymouri]